MCELEWQGLNVAMLADDGIEREDSLGDEDGSRRQSAEGNREGDREGEDSGRVSLSSSYTHGSCAPSASNSSVGRSLSSAGCAVRQLCGS